MGQTQEEIQQGVRFHGSQSMRVKIEELAIKSPGTRYGIEQKNSGVGALSIMGTS